MTSIGSIGNEETIEYFHWLLDLTRNSIFWIVQQLLCSSSKKPNAISKARKCQSACGIHKEQSYGHVQENRSLEWHWKRKKVWLRQCLLIDWVLMSEIMLLISVRKSLISLWKAFYPLRMILNLITLFIFHKEAWRRSNKSL